MVIVNWGAVISAEWFQASFCPDFEPAWKHCCLPASAPLSSWDTGTEFAPCALWCRALTDPCCSGRQVPVKFKLICFSCLFSPGDFSGQLLAYLSLGPIFIIVGFVTLIIFKRELHTVSPPLPSQPLLMTKVFSFVTWGSCIHTSFSLCKEQAEESHLPVREQQETLSTHARLKGCSAFDDFSVTVVCCGHYLSRAIEGDVWGSTERCCRVGTLPRSSRIIALGSICRKWCV